MGYWGTVAKRAWKEAMQGAALHTVERVLIVVCTQAIIAVLIFIGLGETAVRDMMAVRIATALAPFAILPLLFLWRFPQVPPAIEREWEEWKKENDATRKQDRDYMIYNLTNYYMADTKNRTGAMSYGLELPPEEWLNEELAKLGETWRVRNIRGPKYEAYEI